MTLYVGMGWDSDIVDDGTVLTGETDGLGIDFTNGTYFNTDTFSQAWNQVRVSLVDTLSSPHTFYTNGGTSPKVVKTSATGLGWSPHNLALQSQTLDNASYTKATGSITANNTTAPDGTLTADLFTATGTGSVYPSGALSGLSINVYYTLSIYAKRSAGSNFLELDLSDRTNFDIRAWFNLSTGALGTTAVVGSGSTLASSSITSVGNGWYRCAASGLSPTWAPTISQVFPCATDGTHNGAVNGDAQWYWGMQLNRGIAPTAYIATTTAADYALPISYGEGLLVEPAATNLLLQSQDMATTWTNSGSSESVNTTTAPDGSTTADTFIEAAAGTFHELQQTKTLSALTAYTVSVYAKAKERTRMMILLERADGTAGATCIYDLSGGQIGAPAALFTFGPVYTSASGSIQAIGNGWYRCVLTATTDSTTAHQVALRTDSGSGTAADASSYSGDGTSGLYVRGAQLETGTVATSYIPTTTATATRATDAPNVATSAYPHSDTEGTFIAWITPRFTNHSVFAKLLALNNGTTTEEIQMEVFNTDTPDSFALSVADGGVAVVVDSVTKSGTANLSGNKVAIFYKLNDSGILVDGGSEVVDTVCTMPTCTSLQLGYATSIASRELNGFIKRLIYVPRRMTEAEMQVRTRW